MRPANLMSLLFKALLTTVTILIAAIYLNIEKTTLPSDKIENISMNIKNGELIPPGDSILYGKMSAREYRILLNRDYISNEFQTDPTLNRIPDPQKEPRGKTILMALKERSEDIRNGAIEHLVKPGETLSSIASLYGVAEKSIFLRNNDLTAKSLSSGSVIKIIPRAEYRYTIKPGDTLWSISNRYSIDSMDIIKINDMTTAVLRIGQEIMIPWKKRNKDWRKKYNLLDRFSDNDAVVVKNTENSQPTPTDDSTARADATDTTRTVIANNEPQANRHDSNVIIAASTPDRPDAENDAASPGKADAYEARVAAAAPSVGKHPRFARPVSESCTVLSPYGMRNHPIYKRRIFHAGVDIRAKVNTSLISADDGVVEYAGWMRGYGKIIVLRHGNGYSTRYAHMSSFSVAKGQRVKRGQAIGKSGKTGVVTGPHLHFEVRRFGRTLNPVKFL